MNKPIDYDDLKDIDIKIYDWSVRIMRLITKKLKVKMRLHADQNTLQGDIFLFNHFSRFETFIPQFLIYEKTGVYSCSIASAEFFKENTLFATYLNNVGVIPHDHHRLFANLARQVFLGRKVIIFPEGGMVKDHQVMDKHGHYSIYSRISHERRKQHTGAAVLAQGIEIFKAAIRNAYIHKNYAQLIRWQQELKLDSLEQLLVTALKTTRIVPANITFYPIRASDNLLLKGVELFTHNLTVRQTEELLIEGNILLKETDMDLRLGNPVDSNEIGGWYNQYLLNKVATHIQSLEGVFALYSHPKNLQHKWLGYCFKHNVKSTRNQYMQEIYANVTINLSHLASVLIMCCLKKQQQHISKKRFYTVLYIAIKTLQKHPDVNLHDSLLNPDEYIGLIAGQCQRFEQFIQVAQTAKLLVSSTKNYQFLDKLRTEFSFDVIRMENPIVVYSNEVAPIKAVKDTLVFADKRYADISQKQLAIWALDDEVLALDWDRKQYSSAEYADINDLQTNTENAQPFLLQPTSSNGDSYINPAQFIKRIKSDWMDTGASNGVGILLIHGLLASPAELKAYAKHLSNQGYTVLVMRLKGHGTSPYDLREQAYQDWYDSVQRGLTIIAAYCDSVVVIGFSTGGGLALKLAAENTQVCAVVAVAVPIKFVDKSFLFIPLLHGTNRLVEWVSSIEGIKPFIENTPEHPTVNYRHIPVKSLYELRCLVDDVEQQLSKVIVPVLMVYADDDPVVHPDSAQIIMSKLGSKHKECVAIHSNRHGVLMENIGNTWHIIHDFLKRNRINEVGVD